MTEQRPSDAVSRHRGTAAPRYNTCWHDVDLPVRLPARAWELPFPVTASRTTTTLAGWQHLPNGRVASSQPVQSPGDVLASPDLRDRRRAASSLAARRENSVETVPYAGPVSSTSGVCDWHLTAATSALFWRQPPPISTSQPVGWWQRRTVVQWLKSLSCCLCRCECDGNVTTGNAY